MPPKSFIYVKTIFWLKFMLSSYFELCFIYIYIFNFSYLVFFLKKQHFFQIISKLIKYSTV